MSFESVAKFSWLLTWTEFIRFLPPLKDNIFQSNLRNVVAEKKTIIKEILAINM